MKAMLAEDEDSVRPVAPIAVEESGHRALSAGAVEEARARTRTDGSRMDLLVTVRERLAR
jgi:hypothetical protein